MLDLARLQAIRLRPRPLFQRILGALFLAPNYHCPFRPTRIRLQGAEHIPRGGAIFVMNHTDRYNYWPFQYALWRRQLGFTATWVKGKYYENRLLGWFMDAANNIPLPSKGYVLTKDFQTATGRLPDEAEYLALRQLVDGKITAEAAAAVSPAVRDLLAAPGPQLPSGPYLQSLEERFQAMMARVVELSRSALEMGLHLLIFPEGTRSRRLGRGHSGAAQIALHTGAPVIPVGCNGSDRCYPGNSPWSRGGDILYRVGVPLHRDGELAPFRIREPFVPFTRSAEPHQETFRRLTNLLMDRINALLDPEYQHDPQHQDRSTGARRFV